MPYCFINSRWWRELEDSTPTSQITVLATGPKYNIPSAHLGSEGKYHCEANNEMGHGEKATVVLTVYQPPRFLVKLQPHLTRRYDLMLLKLFYLKKKPN